MPDDGPSAPRPRRASGSPSCVQSQINNRRDPRCKRREDCLLMPVQGRLRQTGSPPTPRPDGAVGMWAIQAPNPKPERSANKDCPHFHGPTQKESYMKKPRRAVAVRRAPNRDRPPTAESVGSVVNPCLEPETRNQRRKRIVHMLSTLSAPPRTKNSRATQKDQKTGMPSEFSIGSGRIGPGAASKMRNPHEPSATRSHRDSTRLLTTERYCCWRKLSCCKT